MIRSSGSPASRNKLPSKAFGAGGLVRFTTARVLEDSRPIELEPGRFDPRQGIGQALQKGSPQTLRLRRALQFPGQDALSRAEVRGSPTKAGASGNRTGRSR